MSILVGDIGGTKTGLAVAEADADRVLLQSERRYPSAEFASLGDLVENFIQETGANCECGSFAIAGPVLDERSKATNLPWLVDARELTKRFGWRRVRLLNDLEAVAWGVAALAPDDLATLQPAQADASAAAAGSRNACVVAAGTGLGEAGLYWDGDRHRAFATEGGHTDFAATDEREFALLRYLQQRYGRVSWERVVSGMGIDNLYGFLAQAGQVEHPPLVANALESDGDLAAAVAASAAAGCPVCTETMEWFALLYGREAGNMALKHLALGGVYLAGGIAPKNLQLLQRGGFLQGFLDKGRMRPLLQRMPVQVILNQHAPLLGAARFLLY